MGTCGDHSYSKLCHLCHLTLLPHTPLTFISMYSGPKVTQNIIKMDKTPLMKHSHNSACVTGSLEALHVCNCLYFEKSVVKFSIRENESHSAQVLAMFLPEQCLVSYQLAFMQLKIGCVYNTKSP